MAVHTVLVMLSLLLLLEAQNLELANITIGEPLTNETLSWLSDKWFLIGVAAQNSKVRQALQKRSTVFFYIAHFSSEDTMEFVEYHTIGDKCEFFKNHLGFQRENGTLSKYGRDTIAHLIVLKKHGAFMVAYYLKNQKKRRLYLSAKKPDITPELREVFQKAVKHLGMNKSKIIFFDWKKELKLTTSMPHQLQQARWL